MRYIPGALFVSALVFVVQPVSAADVQAGEAKFQQLCATCHGPAGQGDGPAAAGLNPQPRDLSDPEWQESVDDEFIRKVTAEGGAAVGLAPTMTAFGHALSDEDLDNVVAYIRSLAD